jgi:methionine aminopeptidase
MVSGEDIRDSLAETAEDRASYEAAAKLTDSLVRFAAAEAKAGRKIYELCCVVDREMERLVQEDASGRVGIAFPCAVSTNDIICHLSPCPTDPEVDSLVLAEGDVVKIELGMHVATCPAFTCYSFVLGKEGEEKGDVSGR